MLYTTEVKTAEISLADYCRDYRDSAKFIEYCKDCPCYQHIWCCPEFDFSTDERIKDYRYVYLIGVRAHINEQLREMVTDPVTVGEMSEFITKDCRRYTDGLMLGLEKAIPGSLSFHAGRCYRCQYCQRLFGKPCIHPEEMRSSLEAYGFDVAKTASDLLGFDLEWASDRLPEHLFLISALFTKEKFAL